MIHAVDQQRGALALALAWLVLLGGCGRTPYTNDPPATDRVWVAFGDSLTSGAGAGPGEDYPSQLAEVLGLTILNAGRPGDTTADGLARIDQVLEQNPSVVLLCLGGNDGLAQVPLDETLANLSAIITRLQQAGVFVVLIGVRSASLVDRYQRPFRKLAAEKNTLWIGNILEGVLGNRSLMADTIHPNAAGYRRIAERLGKELRAAGLGPA